MRSVLSIILSCLVGLLVAQPAGAFEIELAQRKLVIEAPEGYCALEQAQPHDKAFLDRLSLALGEDYLLLLMFTDCEELKQYRARRTDRFQRFGQILALRERGAPIAPLAGVSRNAYSAQATANFGRLTEATARHDAFERLSREIAESRISGQRILGLLDRDGAAAYLGLVLRIDAPGDPHVLAGVTATTLVRELRVAINLYRRYENADSLASLLEEQKRIAQRLVERNGETIEPIPADEKPLIAQAAPGQQPAPGDPGGGGFSWLLLGLGLAVLAALGGGIALLLRYKRR